ncbi:hypothetical protein MA16_Dca001140 [Dendrobium catenatum]|uniref:Uncharacterized protein n=1 Tax=Dendrobium catenatum TaxID=906689 RepID=A0A2I0WLK1_9ASPA|nr:hypothetical protein MA16_Dca001140 [Dendrobium catenatum]
MRHEVSSVLLSAQGIRLVLRSAPSSRAHARRLNPHMHRSSTKGLKALFPRLTLVRNSHSIPVASRPLHAWSRGSPPSSAFPLGPEVCCPLQYFHSLPGTT